MHNYSRLFWGFLASSAIAFSSSTAAHGQASSGDSGLELAAPSGWLTDYAEEIESQVERFGSAYSMTPEAQEALRQQLHSKLTDQWRFESEAIARLTKAAEEAATLGNEPDPALVKELDDISKIGPLSDLVIAQQIEATLPPELVTEGRTRLTELLVRRDLQVKKFDADLDLQAEHNGGLAAARVDSEAPLTAAGNPLPRGEKLTSVAPEAVGKMGGETPLSTAVRPDVAAPTGAISVSSAAMQANLGAGSALAEAKPDMNQVRATVDAMLAPDANKATDNAKGAASNGRSAKNLAGRASQGERSPSSSVQEQPGSGRESASANSDARPSRTMPAAVEPVRLQAAPPLDDWDKYVDTTCKKFGFNDSQVIKAQSILKDLRNRAVAYRSSRNEDFAAAERLADAKAKADRKKELSAPIDAFFEELKQRLDNLATLEQRAKTTAPVDGKK